jgi:peptidoglycan/LPS O-acetylase OafA/YrhL
MTSIGLPGRALLHSRISPMPSPTFVNSSVVTPPAPKKTRLASPHASSEYIPALDGMRAVAILLVVAAHFGLGEIVPGGFGVTLFFFISGFLITRLLIAEASKAGTISVSAFYVRRFLRLGPALLMMVAMVTLAYYQFVGPINGSQVLAAVFYIMNYFVIFGGSETMPFGVLWSLAVEEHYYLAYPLLFSRGWRYRKKFLAVLILLSAVVLLWRVTLILGLHSGTERTYYATDTRVDSILYGAILAWTIEITCCTAIIRHFERSSTFAVAVLMLLVTLLYRNEVFRETARYSIQGIALIPLVYAILFVDRFWIFRTTLELPLLLWIGRLSYSLYLWHLAVFFFVGHFFVAVPQTVQYWMAVPIVFGIASLSYYGVERPFQKLRKTFRRA